MWEDVKAMTVAELIAALQRYPQDAEVLYRCCSDYSPLAEGDLSLATAESKQIIYRAANGYSDSIPKAFPEGMVPDFRTCVLFPGN